MGRVGRDMMKKLLVIIVTTVILFAAGFGAGTYSMYLKSESLIYMWIENTQAWQHEANKSKVAADYYRQNAELNIYTAEILKELVDSYSAENADLLHQIALLQYELDRALNPGWGVPN